MPADRSGQAGKPFCFSLVYSDGNVLTDGPEMESIVDG